MTEAMMLVLLLLSGSLLGVLYFGGLWLTVRRLARTKQPWVLYFGSLALRLTLLLGCFFAVLVWQKLVGVAAVIVGFMLARLVMVRVLNRSDVEKAA